MTKFAKVTAMTAALIMCGAVNAATITLDGTNLTIEDAWKIANNEADVAIAPKAMKLLEDSYKLVLRSAASGQQVYGLTVGVGLNKDQKLFTADGKLTDAVIKASRAFNYNALRSHSAAVGKMMPTNLARLSMVVRLNTLLTGKSGAQPRVAELYRDFLNKGVTPLIPSEGSIGEADILMASHVGAVMIGEWKAEVKGKVVDGKTALKRAGITPLVPEGKDALAILSNNSVAVAYAIEAARNAARVIQLTPTVYGLSLEGLNGNVAPILPQTVGQRPFEGLAQTAADMRAAKKCLHRAKIVQYGMQHDFQCTCRKIRLAGAQRTARMTIPLRFSMLPKNIVRNRARLLSTLWTATVSRAVSSRPATSIRCPLLSLCSVRLLPWLICRTTPCSVRSICPMTSSRV